MNVVKYIKQHGVDKLAEEFGIKVKDYGSLVVLSYDQITSPKTSEIVRECRGLILDKNTLEVVCRPFDRFFNHGECPETQEHLDMAKAIIFEKVDGSLIKLFHYQEEWHVGTKGTAFAEAETAFGVTFKELVIRAVGVEWTEFQDRCNSLLDKGITYLFEITSMENRVVKAYSGYTLHFLAARDNSTGEYLSYEGVLPCVQGLGAVPVKQYKFDTIHHCLEAAKALKDLDEGYVVYQDMAPVCKIKSPTYLAVHRVKGEGLTPKRIMQLVLMNEQEEYLTYFPEDVKHFQPYEVSFKKMLDEMGAVWDSTRNIEDQKEFALEVVKYPYSSALFQARKLGMNPVHCFHQQNETYKMRILDSMMEGKE